MRTTIRRALLGISAAALCAVGLAIPAVANASASVAATPLSVALYHNGDSKATWDASGNPVLTAGTDAGTSAQVQIKNVHGTQLPTTEPSFTASASGGGDPRWVIELHNGQYLFGYPYQPAATRWSVNPGGNQNTDYATAVAAAEAGGSDNYITAAFIVDDQGGNSLGAVTLTGVQYNGETLAAPVVFSGGIVNKNSGKCLDVTGAFGTFAAGQGLQQWTCGAAGGEDQHFTLTTEPDNSSYLTIGGLYVTTSTQGAQMTLVTAPTTMVKSGPYYKWTSLVMDVRARSLSNGAVVQGYAQQATNNNNQQWSLP
jgi:hypothetical protein